MLIGLIKLLAMAAVVGGATAGVRSLLARGRAARPPEPGSDAVEMTQCSVCEIYATGKCDRPDCPLG